MQFVKYNVAGTVFFWSTYIMFFVLNTLLQWPEVQALATASIIGHVFYFILDKEWVFSSDGTTKKSLGELLRFAVFMALNYFLNLYFVWLLDVRFGLTPYLGQFVTAGFFVIWSYVGLKYWVFPVSVKRTKKGKQYASRSRKRSTAKQKAARTA